jgi:hypothetical protein
MENPAAEIREIENENGKFTYLGLPERPADLPEKFWHPENGLNLTALNKGYTTLESTRAQYKQELETRLREELKGQLPKAPEKYELPEVKIEGAPEGFAYNPQNDPVVQAFIENGKDLNVPQEAVNKLIERRAMAEKDRFLATGKEVRDVLGENATARIDKLTARLKAALSEEEFGTISSLVSSPKAVVALEKMVGNSATPTSGTNGASPEITEAKLKRMMGDPRYYDPVQRDPEYVAEIEKGFDQLYSGQEYDGQPRFTSG